MNVQGSRSGDKSWRQVVDWGREEHSRTSGWPQNQERRVRHDGRGKAEGTEQKSKRKNMMEGVTKVTMERKRFLRLKSVPSLCRSCMIMLFHH